MQLATSPSSSYLFLLILLSVSHSTSLTTSLSICLHRDLKALGPVSAIQSLASLLAPPILRISLRRSIHSTKAFQTGGR
jgi:hypothetical protein